MMNGFLVEKKSMLTFDITEKQHKHALILLLKSSGFDFSTFSKNVSQKPIYPNAQHVNVGTPLKDGLSGNLKSFSTYLKSSYGMTISARKDNVYIEHESKTYVFEKNAQQYSVLEMVDVENFPSAFSVAVRVYKNDQGEYIYSTKLDFPDKDHLNSVISQVVKFIMMSFKFETGMHIKVDKVYFRKLFTMTKRFGFIKDFHDNENYQLYLTMSDSTEILIDLNLKEIVNISCRNWRTLQFSDQWYSRLYNNDNPLTGQVDVLCDKLVLFEMMCI